MVFEFLRRPIPLAVFENANAELRKLLAIEQQHSANLLEQLKTIQNAYSNALSHGSPFQNEEESVMEATRKEQQILSYVEASSGRVTAKMVEGAFGYSHRSSASSKLSSLVRKGLLQRIHRGKNSAYELKK